MIKSSAISGLLMLTGLALAQPPAATGVTQADPFISGGGSAYTARPVRGFVSPSSTGLRSSSSSSSNRSFSVFHSHDGGKVDAQEAELLKSIGIATSQIAAKDHSAREAGIKDLEAGLAKLFDVRTSSREAQIADLETRLKKLRDQLEERKNRKAEIVDLRLQTILNEANGLSF